MRTKEFRIAKRKKKIKERQKLVVQIARHGNVALQQNKHREKVDAAVSGVKPGLFAKHDYGAVTCGKPVKTKTRKRKASYRHSGGYGPAKRYSAHDQRELDRHSGEMEEMERDV